MFLLRNARVIPELGCGRESLLWDVLIEGERISEIYPCADRKKSFMESYCGEVIDCQGKTLLPGLIDAHTHISIGLIYNKYFFDTFSTNFWLIYRLMIIFCQMRLDYPVYTFSCSFKLFIREF